MSRVRADKLVDRNATGAPSLTYGAEVPVGYGITGAGGINISGVATAGSFVGALTGNVTGSAANITGRAEVYGFTGIGSDLQVTTTNAGADNITAAQYDAFEQVLFAPSGITFSINNNGNLIATF